jgi:hypothetical protein
MSPSKITVTTVQGPTGPVQIKVLGVMPLDRPVPLSSKTLARIARGVDKFLKSQSGNVCA